MVRQGFGMGSEENKELIRRQFELLNAGDVDGAVALWARDHPITAVGSTPGSW